MLEATSGALPAAGSLRFRIPGGGAGTRKRLQAPERLLCVRVYEDELFFAGDDFGVYPFDGLAFFTRDVDAYLPLVLVRPVDGVPRCV